MNYIFPSNTISNNRKNYTNDFQIDLLQPIDGLNRDSYVEVTNISYPNTIQNVVDDRCFFSLTLDYENLSRFKSADMFTHNRDAVGAPRRFTFTGEDNSFKIESDKILINNGVYNLKTLLQTINVKLEEYNIKLSKNTNGKISLTWDSFFEIWTYQTNSVTKNYVFADPMYDIRTKQLIGYFERVELHKGKSFDDVDIDVFHKYNSDPYIKAVNGKKFLNQRSSKNLAKIKKNGFYSTVTMTLKFSESLKYMLGFTNDTITHVSEVNHDKKKSFDEYIYKYEADFLPDIKDGVNSLYIYCDELENIVVGDHNSELLAIVPLKNDENGHGDIEYYQPPLTKKRFKKTHINNLHFTIKDTAGNPVYFDYGNINIETLIYK